MAIYKYEGETETTLNHDPAEGRWYLWTNEKKWLDWAHKYALSNPEELVITEDDVKFGALSVTFPDTWLRMPTPGRVVSQQVRAARAEHMRKLRAQQLADKGVAQQGESGTQE